MKSKFCIFFVILVIANSYVLPSFRGSQQRPRGSQQRPVNVGAVAKTNTAFTGFNDGFKNQMAQLLGEVTNANTQQTKMFKDKLMIGLISIDNTLSRINKDKSQQRALKPLLQHQVKTFLSDLDMVQAQLARLNSSSVIGSNNFAAGRVGIIQGNNNGVIGHQNNVIGNNNLLQGNQSIVAGVNNGVKGNNGITVGNNNQVNANNSFVFTSNDVINRDNTLTIRDSTIDLKSLISNKRRGGYIN